MAYIAMGRLSVDSKDETHFRKSPKQGDERILKGDHIKRYAIKEYLFYSPNDPLVKPFQKEIEKLRAKHIVLHRIVAHVKDHIIPMAALDEKGCFSFITVTNILLQSKDLDEKYIIGLLNSKLYAYYIYKFIFNNAIRSMDFTKETTSKIPIKVIPYSQQQDIVKLVDKMITLSSSLEKYNGKSTDNIDKTEQEMINIDDQINQLVYKIYGINEKERKLIEESLK